jgi:hypothetical protein
MRGSAAAASDDGPEHEVIDQQLRAAPEKFLERSLAGIGLEAVVLVDANPRQRLALARKLVARNSCGRASRHCSRVAIACVVMFVSIEMPPGTGVSGLECDGADRFYCGGGRSGKVRAVRRPRS